MDDKPEVLSLRTNVYRGLDYLPDYYDFFMGDPDRKCIVGHIGPEMVAFGVMLTMDGGQTVLGQAGRVKESHEGQGVFSSLTGYLNSLALQSGGVRRVALVETTLNKYARSERFLQVHREIDSKLQYAGVVTQNLRTRFANKINQNGDVTAVSAEDLRGYLSSDITKRYLFPKDIMLADYVPMRTVPQNLQLFNGRNNQFFSSVRIQNNEVTGLLSAGSSFSCINPPKSYTIDLFGNAATDVEKHVQFHLERACSLHKEPFCLQIFVEKGFIAQKLCSILLKYGIPKCNWYVEGGVSTKTVVVEMLK